MWYLIVSIPDLCTITYFFFCLSVGRDTTELYSIYVCERSVLYWRSLFFYNKTAIIVPMRTLKFGSFTDIKSVFFSEKANFNSCNNTCI